MRCLARFIQLTRTGGSEAAVTPFGYAGFCQMKAMATKYNDNPSKVGNDSDT